MLDPVTLLLTFCIVPVIHRAYEIAGDPADSFELRTLVILLATAVRAFIVDSLGESVF